MRSDGIADLQSSRVYSLTFFRTVEIILFCMRSNAKVRRSYHTVVNAKIREAYLWGFT